jgi:hypothetical protein
MFFNTIYIKYNDSLNANAASKREFAEALSQMLVRWRTQKEVDEKNTEIL